DDLKIDTFRSSGAGGQSVNKTDSAVRITHLPTKTVVECQNERSQAQNKETAMKVLKAKLYKIQQDKEDEEKKKLRGEYTSAEWGNQIRSYIIHPYKLVKDHRTGVESSDPEKVLDGDIDRFIEARLKGVVERRDRK
ncbi:MAG: peptide chain release factor 2, partial [Candidatus Pacebacteria bacterium]|nr:peptide chain release factor 2 [Candidatus Paceibacterota bacterium]